MRCVPRICVALIGLALAVPAAAWAEPPDTCPSCEGHHHQHKFRSPRICANCMRAMQQANGGALVAPPMLMAGTPGCAACQAQAAAGAVPAYAMVGGVMATTEPAPIGVVHTSYQPQAGHASQAPGHAWSGPAGPSDPSAWPAASPDYIVPARSGRPHVLTHMLGLHGFGAWSEARQERGRASHASIGYGPYGQSVNEIPAWMVYGH